VLDQIDAVVDAATRDLGPGFVVVFQLRMVKLL
jgi:hypothetical protein